MVSQTLILYFFILWKFSREICDRLCENRPCSHLIVLRETLVYKDFKLKLPAFAHTRPLLFSRTGLSNLLNKIQFTFKAGCSLVDFRPFQTIFSKVCINFTPALQGVGRREEEKSPQVKDTR